MRLKCFIFLFLEYNKYKEVGYPTIINMKKNRVYIAKLDSKKRIVIRGAKYDYYDVIEYSNGKIILEPRSLAFPQIKNNEEKTITE